MDKKLALLQIAKKRQVSKWPGYKNLCNYHNGFYECDYVSPFTKSAGNVNASVMVLLQDWCSDKFLNGELCKDVAELGHDPYLMTNQNLKSLLEKHLKLTLENTYSTNLFPFIKPGTMNTTIPMRDLIRAAKEFAIPQIRIVCPKLVICLGLQTFNALRRAEGKKSAKDIQKGIESSFLIGSSDIWCQSHTGLS